MIPYILLGAGLLVFITTVVTLGLRHRHRSAKSQIPTSHPKAAPNPLKVIRTESGLKIETMQFGTGVRAAKRDDLVSVHYTGWLTTGQKFDSSIDRNTPFEFRLGHGKVIRGWEEGVRGMLIGEKRRLTIPPQSGYGNRGTAKIPPKSTLVFEIELMGIS